MRQNKRYRPNVAAVILSSEYPESCKLFVAERSDIKGAWQFPQGGVDEEEDIKEALLRELEEEIGTKEVEIIAEHPKWISYDFPKRVVEKMYPFDGQKQKYFLVRLKKEAVINLATEIPEFSQFKFLTVDEALRCVSYYKRAIYRKVIAHFKQSGYL